jgi:hypothetical protein
MHHLHKVLIPLHHTWSQEKVQAAVLEEQPGADPQEIQAQEVSEEEDQGEDLPECVDHQPSSFERGKLRSILSILFIKAIIYIYEFYILLH